MTDTPSPDAVAPVARPDVNAIHAMLDTTRLELRSWRDGITSSERRAVCIGLNLCDGIAKLLAYIRRLEAEAGR